MIEQSKQRNNASQSVFATVVLVAIILAAFLLISYRLGWIFRAPTLAEGIPSPSPTPTAPAPVVGVATPVPPELRGLSQGYLALIDEAQSIAENITVYRGIFLNTTEDIYRLNASFSNFRKRLPSDVLSQAENAVLLLYVDANLNFIQSNRAYLSAFRAMLPLEEKEFVCSDKIVYEQAISYLHNASLAGAAGVEDLAEILKDYSREAAAVINLTENTVFLVGFFDGLNNSINDLRETIKTKCP